MGEADGAWVPVDLAHAQALPLVQADPQESPPARRLADPLALLLAQAGGQEAVDVAHLVDDGDRTEAGVEELAGLIDDLLEDGVEVELAVDVQGGAVQGQELAVAPRQALVQPVEDAVEGPEQEQDGDRQDSVQHEPAGPAIQVGVQKLKCVLENPDEEDQAEQEGPLHAGERPLAAGGEATSPLDPSFTQPSGCLASSRLA